MLEYGTDCGKECYIFINSSVMSVRQCYKVHRGADNGGIFPLGEQTAPVNPPWDIIGACKM